MARKLSRRSFVPSSRSGVAAAGLYFSSSQSTVGFIGTGIHFHTASGRGATEFGRCAAIADLDGVQLGRAKQVIFDQHIKHNRPTQDDSSPKSAIFVTSDRFPR